MGIITGSLGALYDQMENVLGVVERVADKAAASPKLGWMGLGIPQRRGVVAMRRERLAASRREWAEFLRDHPDMPGVQQEGWDKMRRRSRQP